MMKNDSDFSLDRSQMSYLAHIFRFRSAHGYYRLEEYEPRTLTQLEDTRGQNFLLNRENAKDPIVNT